MSVVSVQPKDFILALFIRDDGERFLLGDNGYDFIDSQLHFSANTIENDEVEKQGADGTMLAGQVRRASVQTFDGYVGDATTPKEEIEQMRRAFIAFFLKGHHYRVVYVDCARNAWQRKGGYLVDAPEVKELFQVHPEYHVGLNFEDVNYYSYDENAEGDEITANLVQVAISSAVEGGLVWDEDGAVSEDATVEYITETAQTSGKNISISDAVSAPLNSLKIDGETSQQTYTGKNLLNLGPKSDGGVAGAITDGSTVTVTGTALVTDGKSVAELLTTLQAGTYTFTIDHAATHVINFTVNTSNGNVAFRLSAGGTSITKTLASASTGGNVFWAITQGQTYNETFKLQLVSGSTPDYDYEPYVGGIPAPNPDYPQTVQTVTGENVVKISDGQGNEQSYTIDLGSIELCKIGTYQDYIYKDGTDWKIHKEIGKSILDSSNYNSRYGTNSYGLTQFLVELGVSDYYDTTNYMNMLSNAFAKQTTSFANTQTQGFLPALDSGSHLLRAWIRILTTTADTADQFKAWLNANSPIFYYKLDTATETTITNAALIEQLDAILAGGTHAGTNNIALIPSGNEQGSLEITYYTKYVVNITAGGYEWEQGGSGGPTIVMNESIDNVYPIWTITGPITNPVLENTTTGEQIEYVGTIGEGQKLIIDMGAQTALLDGLNVISNVAGEFISLAPGANTLLYSVSNGDTASEIGWSEIVG